MESSWLHSLPHMAAWLRRTRIPQWLTTSIRPTVPDHLRRAPPPAWFKDLNPVYLEVINELDSGAIHPNDGDHKKQEAIDRNLTEAVDSMFIEILDRVYERPKIRRIV
jgi:hypothetical protein